MPEPPSVVPASAGTASVIGNRASRDTDYRCDRRDRREIGIETAFRAAARASLVASTAPPNSMPVKYRRSGHRLASAQ
jgi:hypothetical protein